MLLLSSPFHPNWRCLTLIFLAELGFKVKNVYIVPKTLKQNYNTLNLSLNLHCVIFCYEFFKLLELKTDDVELFFK